MSETSSATANSSHPFNVGDALVLAGLTAAAYVVAYGFESGFCEHFSVPEDFIRVSVEALIKSFVSIFGFLALLIWWVDPALNFLSELKWNKLRDLTLGVHAVFICLAIPFFIAFGFSWRGARGFLYLVLLIDLCVVIFIGLAYLWYRWVAKKGTRSALEQQSSVPTNRVTVFGLLFRYVDPRYAMPMIALPLAYGVAWLAGIHAARSEIVFSHIPSKNLIIVRSYGDVYVCKPVSAFPDQLAATTVVLKIDQLTDVSIDSKVFRKAPTIEERLRDSTSPSVSAGQPETNSSSPSPGPISGPRP